MVEISKVANPRPRKKRKTYSCDSCRKFKTRCDFEPLMKKCHRCRMLNLECSLTNDPELEVKFPDSNNSAALGQRVDKLESQLEDVQDKLELILSKLDQQTAIINLSSTSAIENTADCSLNPSHLMRTSGLKLQEPPLKLIQDIDIRLFPARTDTETAKVERSKRPFVVARQKFWDYFDEKKSLCLELSHQFLVKSHFWIIPGGLKTIDEDYVKKHSFITSVFTIISMGFDENNKYEQEQEILYPLVERLLTNTLTMFEKLIDHDIEALLYCCMYPFSRKSKRHRQLTFNPLVLVNFAMNSLINIVDFHKIKERVLIEETYSALDLYHLRILNSLTACKLQYSIGFGNFAAQDALTKEFNNLTAKYPQSNFGDDIKISEINLSDIVNSIFINFKDYFKNFKAVFKQGGNRDRNDENLIVFPELDYWLKNWEELLSKDNAGVLWFSYEFYYIMICRCFLVEFHDSALANDESFFDAILQTMKQNCISLINGFLKLPSSLIKGAPAFTLNQLVYTCLTLCDFLHLFTGKQRQQTLNLCTKIYWHLNTIGERRNEATENVGMIIKCLIDTSREKVKSTWKPPKNSPIIMSPASQLIENNVEPNMQINIPDVERFNTFEDFFQDFFEHLQPTTQNMFSTRRSSVSITK